LILFYHLLAVSRIPWGRGGEGEVVVTDRVVSCKGKCGPNRVREMKNRRIVIIVIAKAVEMKGSELS
jgi:hypothetical protein